MYDRRGLRGLVVLPFLAAAVPLLSFATSVPAVVSAQASGESGWACTTRRCEPPSPIWCLGHDVAAGYGTFTAVYGIAWLVGAAIIGVLYDHGTSAVEVFVVAAQGLALALLVPLLRERKSGSSRRRVLMRVGRTAASASRTGWAGTRSGMRARDGSGRGVRTWPSATRSRNGATPMSHRYS